MSVVAALSDWLVHTNRRLDGSWTQRYEHGVPTTDLVAIEADGTTGTTVRFLAGPTVPAPERLTQARFQGFASRFPHLDVMAATTLTR